MPSGEKQMKAYISIDMEGVCGIVREIETDPKKGGDAYQQSRHQMTQEANAAIEGCIKGGATEVLIADSHWNFDNLIPEELHEASTVLRGTCIRRKHANRFGRKPRKRFKVRRQSRRSERKHRSK